MRKPSATSAFTAADMRIALSEIYPDTAYGAVPVQDQYDAIEAYRAFADGGLHAAPRALAAYVTSQQRQGD